MVADLNPVGQFRLRVMICEPIAAESSYFHHGIAHDLFKYPWDHYQSSVSLGSG